MFAIRAGIVLLALLMGLLQLMPSVFLERAVRARGGEFLIAQMTHHGDTAIHYLPKAREVIDGHFPAIDAHVPENRSGLFLWAPGPQLVFASALWLFPDVNHAYMALGFVFTAIMFFLWYWLGRMFFGSRVGAILFGAIGVLTPAATHFPRAFFSPGLFMDLVGKNFIPVVHTPIHQLFLSRIEHPLITMWLYIVVFALLYRFFMAPSAKRATLLGFAIGLQLYFYVHFWVYAVIIIGLLFLYTYFFRRSETLEPWLLFFGVVGICSIPYAVNFFLLNQLPNFYEQSFRIGFEYGWGFRLSAWPYYIFYSILGALALSAIKKEDYRKRVFVAVVLLAMVVALNVQLFFGWNPQPDHWLKVYGVPQLAVISLIIAALIVRLRDRLNARHFGVSLLILGTLLTTLLVVKKIVNAAAFIHPTDDWVVDYSFNPAIVDSWRWINERLSSSPVFISNSLITSIYLTGYTSADPYPVFAQNSIASNYDVEQRFLIAHKLFGTPPERFRWLLEYRKNPFLACADKCDVHTALNLSKAPAFLYGQTYNNEFNIFDSFEKETGVSDYRIPPTKIRELVERYQRLHVNWSDFRGAYVYVGPWERELIAGDFTPPTDFERVYANSQVAIYRIP